MIIAGFHWDARLDDEGNVKSLPANGLHTGPTAIKGRKVLGGRVLGLRLRHLRETGHVGVVEQTLQFDQRLKISTRYGDDLFGRCEWRRQMPTRTRIGVQIDRSSGI